MWAPTLLKCSRSSHPVFCEAVSFAEGADPQLRLIFSLYRLAAVLPDEKGLWVKRLRPPAFFTFF